jgi:hypothetical protein
MVTTGMSAALARRSAGWTEPGSSAKTKIPSTSCATTCSNWLTWVSTLPLASSATNEPPSFSVSSFIARPSVFRNSLAWMGLRYASRKSPDSGSS